MLLPETSTLCLQALLILLLVISSDAVSVVSNNRRETFDVDVHITTAGELKQLFNSRVSARDQITSLQNWGNILVESKVLAEQSPGPIWEYDEVIGITPHFPGGAGDIDETDILLSLEILKNMR
eukprot:TRINITY_DN115_c0_g1_i8.p1 TRINITY_DN115_c0_g1~~TRINITY_DN115_c0_g1_i8.p1  ORF type:complete len:124 (+),score=19.33 TRINITY_DN115_c0_g1_i8:135-506(+)